MKNKCFFFQPRDQEFEFPDVCTSEEHKKRTADDEKSSKMSQEFYKDFVKKQGDRPGIPGWFSF